eukprot:scaffold39918_cov47-Phaeocystis_antarctica.AAC.2
MLAPVSRTARLEDQLQLDDEANSEIADGGAVVSCRRHRTSVGDYFANFQRQRPPAGGVASNRCVLRERPP